MKKFLPLTVVLKVMSTLLAILIAANIHFQLSAPIEGALFFLKCLVSSIAIIGLMALIVNASHILNSPLHQAEFIAVVGILLITVSTILAFLHGSQATAL